MTCASRQFVKRAPWYAAAVTLPLLVLACGAQQRNEAAGDEVRTVAVKLHNNSIELPEILDTGLTEFDVTNEGAEALRFGIEGEGVRVYFDEALQPGASRSVLVNLKPGAYRVFCPEDKSFNSGRCRGITVTAF